MKYEDLVPSNNRLDYYLKVTPAKFGESYQTVKQKMGQALFEAYRDGFVGCFINDSEQPDYAKKIARFEHDRFVSEAPYPSFSANCNVLSTNAGKGKRAINWNFALKLDPTAFDGAQNYGNCTFASMGWEGVTALMGTRVLGMKKEESWKAKHGCAWYSTRGHCGAGSALSQAASAMLHLGLQLRLPYLNGKYDFTNEDDDERYGASTWCRSGPPSDLIEVTSKNKMKTITYMDDTSVEACMDVLNNGGTIHTGSNWTGTDGDPIGSRRRIGAHAQMCLGYDDTDEFKDWYKEKTGKTLNEPVFITGQTWGCYDKDTEILTENGWCKFSELKKHVKVATLNPVTHELEYNVPTKYFEYDFDGYLQHIDYCGVDLLITNNHNVYVSSPRKENDNWKLKEVKDLPQNFKMKKNCRYNGIEVKTFMLNDTEINMDLWLEFLGYFISEGHTTCRIKSNKKIFGDEITLSSTNEYIVGISQKENGGKFNKIKKLLEHPSLHKFKFRRQGDTWVSYSKELFYELVSLGQSYEKHIPDYVWECSSRQLHILFQALMLGDGSKREVKSGKIVEYYYTSSQQLADDFQRLLLHIGYAGDIRYTNRIGRYQSGGTTQYLEYQIGIRKERVTASTESRSGDFILPEYYNDKIYCVEVPNHIVYVRRNGKAVWCGNSWNNVSNWPNHLWGKYPQGAFIQTWSDFRYLLSTAYAYLPNMDNFEANRVDWTLITGE